MSVKLLMTWDIAPEREQDYFEFLVREFIPGIQRLVQNFHCTIPDSQLLFDLVLKLLLHKIRWKFYF